MDVTEFWKPKYKPLNMRMKPFVIIEDGHGMNTPGKRSPLFEEYKRIGEQEFFPGDFFRENEFNQPVCNNLENLLKTANIPCVQLTPHDQDPPLNRRMAKENEYHRIAVAEGKDPILISVHANAYQPTQDLIWRPGVHGLETFYREENSFKSQLSKTLAINIQNKIVTRTNLRSRGVKNANFFVLRNSKSPAVLVEGPFMTNPNEIRLLISPVFQHIFAIGIFQGILDYYQLPHQWTNNPKEERKV